MSQDLQINSQRICPNRCRTKIVRRGHFQRKCDGIFVQRYLCTSCGTSFSDSSFRPDFGQKKRHFNQIVFKLLVGGFSQRRTALDLKINRKTVVRKFIWMGGLASELLRRYNRERNRAHIVEFDDLETSIHTKCKPVSVTLAVEHSTRWILGFEVSNMPAKGKLAHLSRKKYGPRIDERPQGRERLFTKIKPLLEPNALIKSDQNPHYGIDVKRHFPDSEHQTFKGRRGCVVGQGELKRGGFDPLFSLNHTFAMLRANINRLFRRTWCTSKRKDRLTIHIALYTLNHNLFLIDKGRAR